MTTFLSMLLQAERDKYKNGPTPTITQSNNAIVGSKSRKKSTKPTPKITQSNNDATVGSTSLVAPNSSVDAAAAAVAVVGLLPSVGSTSLVAPNSSVDAAAAVVGLLQLHNQPIATTLLSSNSSTQALTPVPSPQTPSASPTAIAYQNPEVTTIRQSLLDAIAIHFPDEGCILNADGTIRGDIASSGKSNEVLELLTTIAKAARDLSQLQ